MQAFDVLITRGTVVDGTGAPGFEGAVGVVGASGGRDATLVVLRDAGEIEAATAVAGRVIDAIDKVVAPGFIDLHSHSGLMILADPVHAPKVRQGVTTELVGVDGNAYAPFANLADLAAFVELNGGLDGRPEIDYDWDTVASYLSRFDGTVAVNVAYLIGNSALRICALGWEEVAADRPAADRMRSLLREGMEEGAFGLSTGLDYPPGSYATTEEIAGLGREAARLGGFYHTHVRYQLGDRYLDPFREALEIGRSGDVPVHVTHLYRRATSPGGPEPILDLIESARASGMDVSFDAYPYPWSSTRLLILMPLWIQSGGPDAIKGRLADAAIRPRLREAVDARGLAYGGENVWATIRLGAFRTAELGRYEGWSIAAVAADRDQHPADAMADMLVAEDLGVNEVAAGPDPVSLPRFVTHPLGMVGTDSIFIGDYPSPRTYGSYPRILAEFVRDRGLLTLEEAVWKMTGYPAQRLGITDRGVLRDGAFADVTVFDPQRIRSNATYEEPRREPDGVDYVFVNGTPVVDEGLVTGALPGHALRHRAKVR
jgi:N-acyl-D-amino-acid deacylase